MPVDQLFFTIFVVLVGAKLLAKLFHRIKQPPLVGELLAGIILGPSLLGLIAPSQDTAILSNLSVFFLMFLAGLSINPRELTQAGRKAIIISVFSFAIPFVSGAWVSTLFGLDQTRSWFMGLLLSITAVPVSAIILMQLGVLKTRLGTTVMTAAVINDILSLIVLSYLLQIAGGTHHVDSVALWMLSINIGLFIGGVLLLDVIFTSPRARIQERLTQVFRRFHTREAGFGLVIIGAVGLSLIAEYIGLHFIIGTFFAGLIVYKEIIGKANFDKVYGIVSGITFGFFAPLFFGLIGVAFRAQLLAGFVPLFAGLLAVAVSAKIGGGYLGARIAGFPREAGLAIGFLMNGRGVVQLAIAAIGYSAGIIDLTLFTIAVAVGVSTTVIAPMTAAPLVARAKAKGIPARQAEEQSSER